MPRLKIRPPKLSKDREYAIVYCGGERLIMGRWGTQESDTNYKRFLAEWASCEQSASDRRGYRPNVEDVVSAYLDYCETNLDSRDYAHTKTISQFIIDLYAGHPIDDFGPKALAAVQKSLEESGRFSRSYINKLISKARAIFRWGVGQELVPVTIAEALKYVQPLRQGRTTARESEPRQAVPDDIVERTLPILLPTVAAMVQVQRLAAMRPNEVCRMTVGDIDTSGDIWIYRPPKHKGTWRGHKKSVALGKPEQEIIGPRLAGKAPEDAVFSPKDAELEKKAKDAAKRKTPVQPSQRKRAAKRAKKPRSRVGDFYDTGVYGRSIKRSIEIANRESDDPIPHWTPYQLRHSAITEIAYENRGDLNIARAVAGQKTISVTQGYNHADVKIAIEEAKRRSAKKADKKPAKKPKK